MSSNQVFLLNYLLFNFFELLNVLYFYVVWVMCQQVDGVGHHILRQQRKELVCWYTLNNTFITPVSHTHNSDH